MKKFVFSLESLLKVKKTKKKKLEEDMAVAIKRLRQEEAMLFEMKLKKASVQKKIKSLSEQGTKVFDLKQHGLYFRLISERIEKQTEKCSQIQKEWELIKTKLIDVHNEIDVLERLKHEQYKQYMYELQKTEEKALEDIVNFKFMTRSESIYG